ncbi:MAG: phenylacetate-CoA oxygenase subunit PaaC [Bacteroidia bacterium]|nr:phenylacetate-CoA oxygenase subunit PaaC [Bacteroidia bacterium]
MDQKEVLFDYILHLADNSMIIGQRNSEWCGHGPVLEQDIALTNIALDLIGEARSLYQYAAEIKGGNCTEDSLPFLRDIREFRNLLLVEQPNTDWAYTIVRQFFFDVFHYLVNKDILDNSNDLRLKEIAAKTIKESTYHLKWSSEWVIRLGDGTDISKLKMQTAVDDLWDFTGELFILSETEQKAMDLGFGADLKKAEQLWHEKVKEILNEACLTIPSTDFAQQGGKTGIHSEHFGYILAEMQFMQRAYPGLEW